MGAQDTMQKFRDGQSNVLITTNVLARGIDVLSVTMVRRCGGWVERTID